MVMPLTPSLAHGLAHLDVELADLMRRHLSERGHHQASSSVQWWCAAIALVSRAHARGHVALDWSALQGPQGLDLLEPVDSKLQGELKSFVQQWVLKAPAEVHGLHANAEQSAVAQAVMDTGLLRWDLGHLYMPRLLAAEVRVAQSLVQRAQARTPLSAAEEHSADQLLQTWFDDLQPHSSADQQEACRRAAHTPLAVVTGGPGTGKTYTAARLIALLQALRAPGSPPIRVALAAPTGKAAARLRQALEYAWGQLRGRSLPEAFWDEAWASIEPPKTVHALLADWGRAERALPMRALGGPCGFEESGDPLGKSAQVGLLMIDEASMLDLELMDELLQHLQPQARLVLIGDSSQLSSVEAGSILSDLCAALRQHPAHSALQHSRRFDGTIGSWARGLLAQDPHVLREIESVAYRDRKALLEAALGPSGWGAYFEALGRKNAASSGDTQVAGFDPAVRQLLMNLDQFRVLAAVRQGPWGVEELNRDLEQAMAARGLLNLREPWPHGRVLMVTRNDDATGLRNGDVGVVLCGPGSGARFAWMAGHELRFVGVSRLPPHEPAFAMTIHKSQGSEFNRVLLVLPDSDHPVLCRELLYTGLTRAKNALSWWLPNPSVLAMAAGRSTRRMSGLKARLMETP